MSAPTTAEVREAVKAAWANAQSDGPYSNNVYAQGSYEGRANTLESVALPLAEERDAERARAEAAEAEVGRLRAALDDLTSAVVRHLRDDDCVDCARRITDCTCGHPIAVAMALAAKGEGR